MKNNIFKASLIFVLIILFTASIHALAYNEYDVRTGDSLWTIAREQGTTIEEIIEINTDIENNQIYVGQTILLPGTNNAGNNNIYYTIKSGDSLWTIANSFNTTIEMIKKLNNISDNELYPGQNLIISTNEKIDETDETEKESRNPFSKNIKPYTFYRVEEGDTVYGIASDFGIRTIKLIRANNISWSDSLEPEDILIIPLENSGQYRTIIRKNRNINNFYQVKRNENVEDIANSYNIPEEVIINLNNLKNIDDVYTGQSLKMPVNPALFRQHTIYTVQDDNKPAHEIAYEYGISIRSILKAN